MRTLRLLPLVALTVVVLQAGAASAVPVVRTITSTAGAPDATWTGTAAVGLNANYNGLVDEGTSRTCGATPDVYCEYTLLALSNAVPADDADGRLRRNATVTLDQYSLQSPLSDFDVTVYATDAAGSVRGTEVGTSANTDVVDPDEVVTWSVTTTTGAPTQYFLVEVAYFTSLNATYRGTLKF